MGGTLVPRHPGAVRVADATEVALFGGSLEPSKLYTYVP